MEPTEYEALGAHLEEDAVWGGCEKSSTSVIGRIVTDLRPLVPIVVQGMNGLE